MKQKSAVNIFTALWCERGDLNSIKLLEYQAVWGFVRQFYEELLFFAAGAGDEGIELIRGGLAFAIPDMGVDITGD